MVAIYYKTLRIGHNYKIKAGHQMPGGLSGSLELGLCDVLGYSISLIRCFKNSLSPFKYQDVCINKNIQDFSCSCKMRSRDNTGQAFPHPSNWLSLSM